MPEISYTIAAPCSHQVEIRKSRFLARAAPVGTVMDALDFLRGIVEGGTSSCWAYRIGQEYRFSDDNEPTGSAGKPILAAIDGHGLDRVAVVVTRWFGGTKLGIGGLMRAYGGSAAECLRQAQRIAIVPRIERVLACSHPEYARIKPRMAAFDITIQDERFGARGVTARLSIPARDVDAWHQLVADVTHGRGVLTSGEATGNG